MTGLLYAIAACGTAAALLQWPRKSPWHYQVLLGVFILGSLLIFTRRTHIVTIGTLIFGLAILLTLLHALISASTRQQLILVLIMSSTTLTAFTFAYFHFPGTGILSLLCGINIGLYAWIQWKKRAEFYPYLGILTLITTESLIRFIIATSLFF